MTDDERDAWVSGLYPGLWPRAAETAAALRATGARCVLSPGNNSDDPPEICFAIYMADTLVGCASLDHEGLSFFVDSGGESDAASDDALIEAVKSVVTTAAVTT